MTKRILALLLAYALLLAAFAAAEELDFTMEPETEAISDEEILQILYHSNEESDLLSHRLDEEHNCNCTDALFSQCLQALFRTAPGGRNGADHLRRAGIFL